MSIKIKSLKLLPDYKLDVIFENGYEVIYDVKDDIESLPTYKPLEDKKLFDTVKVDQSSTSIIWTKAIDLPSDILYQYGTPIN